MKPVGRRESPAEEAATAAALATWPGDRPVIVRLLECRLLHRADWQYLGTRDDAARAPRRLDSYRCDRCMRTWEASS